MNTEFDIGKSKAFNGSSCYGFTIGELEYNKHKGSEDLNEFVSKYNADNFIDIEWNDISIGNILKIKNFKAGYGQSNYYKELYRVEHKIISEAKDSNGEMYGNIFIRPFTNRSNPLILSFKIMSHGYADMENYHFECEDFSDKMIEAAKGSFMHNNPLSRLDIECEQSKEIYTVKIVPDNILCDFFDIEAPGLTLVKI